jgi:DNA invertase Pin-like site-specific DNA recombinase
MFEFAPETTKRQFDLVMAWSVDRLGRSLQDLVGFLSELHSLGVDLYLHQQGIDTTTPAGKAMFQMMGVFDEFERAMIPRSCWPSPCQGDWDQERQADRQADH